MDKPTNNTLRECPFCASDAEYYSENNMVTVRCATCGATPSGWWDELEDAAAEWNRRTPYDTLTAERDRAVEDLNNAAPCFACINFRRNKGDCFGCGRCRYAEPEMSKYPNGFEWADLQREGERE